MPAKRLTVVNIRLDDETLAILKAEAERQHRALANLIAAAVTDFAAKLRDKAAKAKK